MARKIRLQREAYGTYARASAVADFVELVALLSPRTFTEESLKDYLRDIPLVIPPERFPETGSIESGEDDEDGEGDREDGQEDSPDADVAAAEQRFRDSSRRVFGLLEDRARILGERYPFKFDRGELRRRSRRDTRVAVPYLTLLAIATAHATGTVTTPDPKKVFEETVVRALRGRGWLCGGFGTACRPLRARRRRFADALISLGRSIGLTPDPSAAIYSEYANDEKVDTLVNLGSMDERVGRWTFIGQATVEKSDGWAQKLDEPKPNTWQLLLDQRG